MTVSTETPLHIYTANGVTTEWSYTFTTLQNSDVHLIVATDGGVESEISSSDFTLDSVNKTVTYPKTSSGLTPVANGYKVVVYRQVTANQTLDLDNSQPYTLTQLETSYDKLTAMLQDVKNDLTRVPHWKKSEVPTSTEVEDLITDISNVAANTALAIAAADRAEAAAIAGLPYLHAITDVGCACNGSTDDYSTLNTYFTTNTDDCALFIPSRTLIGTSWSVPTNIKAIIFDSANGQLSVPTTKTLTFTGQYIDCPSNKFIFYGAGTYAGTIANEYFQPQFFGAVADDTTDCTVPIQKSLAFLSNVFLSKGTYKITDYITVSGGKHLFGIGASSIIKQYTEGKPILVPTSERVHIYNLKLMYDAMQTNQYSHGIHIQNLYESVIERVHIQYAYVGIFSDYFSVSDSSDTTSNFIYSVTIRDIRIAEYKYYGLYLSSYSAGNTGCIVDNIYINNYDSSLGDGTKRIATGGALFKNFNECTIRQLNIEHTVNANCVVINNCNTITLESLHIEGCDNTSNYNGFIDIVSANVSIDGVMILNNAVTVAALYSLLRFSTSGKVYVKNFSESGNTISGGGSGRYVYAGAYDSDIAVYIDSITYESVYNSSGFNSPTTNSDPPMLRKLNDTIYYQVISGRKQYYLSAMPTTGTFAIGDRVINSSSSISQSRTSFGKQIIYGWLRLTASSNHVLDTDWVELLIKTKNQELPYYHAIANIGCVCDGVTNDYTALNSFFTTHTEDCCLFIPAETLINTSWSIPTNIKSIIFDQANGKINIGSAKTLTLMGQYIDAGMQDVLIGAGTLAGSVSNKEVYPQWFGALADDSNDDTTAIRNALIVSNNVCLPVGTYKTTDYILITSNKSFYGAGKLSIIKQYTAGKSATIVTGTSVHIYDLTIRYDQLQTNEYSHAMHLRVLYNSIIERIQIQYAYSGIFCGYFSSTNNADTTDNNIYGCQFRDIVIKDYNTYGLYLSAYTLINSTCSCDNIHINNYDSDLNDGTKRSCTAPAFFKYFRDSSANNLKIENSISNNSIVINACKPFTLSNFHIEGCNNDDNYNGFVDIISSDALIDGGYFLSNTVTVANIYSLFRISTSGILRIRNIVESSNTVSGGGVGYYAYSGTYNSNMVIYLESFTSSTYATNGLPSPTTNADPPILRRLNEAIYYQTLGSRKQYYLGAMPTTGTFAIGDRVINTSSSIAESGSGGSKYILYGWMRITASSNNVLNTDWVELRCLTGN